MILIMIYPQNYNNIKYYLKKKKQKQIMSQNLNQNEEEFYDSKKTIETYGMLISDSLKIESGQLINSLNGILKMFDSYFELIEKVSIKIVYKLFFQIQK